MMNNSRLLWVDSMKGICAIIVLCSHIFVTLSTYDVYDGARTPILHNIWDGNFAVHIFILLSALLTCYGIDRHRENVVAYYKQIVLKRYFRLLLPVGVIVLLMFLFQKFGLFYAEEYGQKTNNGWLIGQYISFKELPGSIFAAPLGKCYKVLNVGWMLGYVFFSTFWVIILDLLCVGRSAKSRIVLLVICGFICLRTDFYYFNVVVAYTLYSFRDMGKISRWLIGLSCIVVFVASDFVKYTDMWSMLRAICVVSLVFYSTRLKFVIGKISPNMGLISLNIYLLQLMVIYIFTCRMADSLPDTYGAKAMLYVSTILITVLFAYFYTRYIESNLNKISSRILQIFS